MPTHAAFHRLRIAAGRAGRAATLAIGEPKFRLGNGGFLGPISGAQGADRSRVAATHAERDTGQLLAAEMYVPAAEHLSHLLALAAERSLTVADMMAMPFYHPVFEEGLRSALRVLARDVARAGGSDLSDCRAIGYDALN